MARQRILDAAATLADQEGVNAVSLERVADRAGVSKGGLLYHFKTKEALLAAMLQSVMDAHDEEVQRRVEAGEDFMSAVVEHCLSDHDKPSNLMSAFIAAVATDGSARDLVRRKKEAWHKELMDAGMSESQALLFGLAMDGLFVGTALGVTELTDSDRQALRDSFRRLSEPTEEARLADWFQQALAAVEG